jgi:hypothetical protein
MNWFNILKESRQITDIGFDFDLPEEEESENEDDNNCCKEAFEEIEHLLCHVARDDKMISRHTRDLCKQWIYKLENALTVMGYLCEGAEIKFDKDQCDILREVMEESLWDFLPSIMFGYQENSEVDEINAAIQKTLDKWDHCEGGR